MATLEEVTRYMDGRLRTAEIPDYPVALNGLQVESDAEVRHVAAAVDARLRTIQGAASCGAELLLVHHGMFWGGLLPVRGRQRRRLSLLLERRIALYSSHLPLDLHPELGNNVLLARELGLAPSGAFARYEQIQIGVRGECGIPTAELLGRADRFARSQGGSARHSTFEQDHITRHWAICSGAGADKATLTEAAELGIDTLIVGEGAHWTAVDAEEMGLVIIYAGHYATETLGVRALAADVATRFGLSWSFIDAPTGL